MSRGYTTALASTAPVAPATALPHGGNGFDWAAIWQQSIECLQTPGVSVKQGSNDGPLIVDWRPAATAIKANWRVIVARTRNLSHCR